MRPESSGGITLRTRIRLAFALLAFVLCAIFGTLMAISLEAIEAHAFRSLLQEDAQRIIEAEGDEAAVLARGVHFFRGASIPPDLATLAPGHHELEPPEGSIHILVLEHGGEHLVVVREEGDFSVVEDHFALLTGAAIVAMFLLTVLLAELTVGRVITPVRELAAAVSAGVDEDHLPALGTPDEIGSLARAFAARSGELRRVLERERMFTGDISHELRTPLTVIAGAGEMIEAQAKDRPALAAAANRIQRAAAELTAKVSAFLLLSRAPQTLERPHVALRPLVERELEQCRPLLSGKPVALEFESRGDPVVEAHPVLVAAALGNLLRNACQYTLQGRIRVVLKEACLMVEDSGPGLPETVRSRLFQRFVETSENGSGAGLGLSIVRRVAEHLGWQLELSQPETGGSRWILAWKTPPS